MRASRTIWNNCCINDCSLSFPFNSPQLKHTFHNSCHMRWSETRKTKSFTLIFKWRPAACEVAASFPTQKQPEKLLFQTRGKVWRQAAANNSRSRNVVLMTGEEKKQFSSRQRSYRRSVAWGRLFDLPSPDGRDSSVSLFYFHRGVRGQAQLQNGSLGVGGGGASVICLRWEHTCCNWSLNPDQDQVSTLQLTKQQRGQSHVNSHTKNQI